MKLIARICGVALLSSLLVAGLGLALLRPDRNSSDTLLVLLVACVAAIVGAIAGAAHEVTSARDRRLQAKPTVLR